MGADLNLFKLKLHLPELLLMTPWNTASTTHKLKMQMMSNRNGSVSSNFCGSLLMQFFASVSLAHPLSDEESLELFKRYFDPIRFAMGRK